MNRKWIGLGALLLIVLILAGAGVGGWWWWTHRVKPNVADYLPSGTLLFVDVPDADATRKAYELSHLKKVMESTEIKSLWDLALEQVSKQAKPEDKAQLSKAGEIWNLVQRNLTGESFLAVTEVNLDDTSKVGFIAGLNPKQGLGDIAPLVDRIKKEAAEEMKSLNTGKGTYGGANYEWWEVDGKNSESKVKLCLGVVGPWEIFTVGEKAFNDFVDRYQKKTDASTALSKNPNYLSVLAKLDGRQDVMAFFAMDQAVDLYVKFMESIPGVKISADSLKKLGDQMKAQTKGIGAGFRFEDGRIRESIVALVPKATRPDLGKMYAPCAYKTMPFTTPQTYLYMAQSFDAHKYWDYLLGIYTSTMPEAANAMNQAPEWAKSQGLDFNKNILDALGNEYSFLLDWPDESAFPDFALLFEVANPADFKPTIDVILKTVSPMLAMGNISMSDAKAGAYDLKVFRSNQAPMISPSLIVSGDKFGIILTQPGAKRMLEHANGDSLAKAPSFTGLGGNDLSGTSFLFYVNTGGLVERTYTTLKPYVGFAAMASPDLQQLLGSGKLPDKLSFTGDLGAYLMRVRINDEGSVSTGISNVGSGPMVAVVGAAAAGTVFHSVKSTSVHSPASVSPTTASSEPTADSVKAELEELRAVIEAYAVAQDVSKGTAVTWAAISTYLVPDSPLAKNGGKDPLGNAYLLGVVGVTPADVAPETKAKFPDHDANFWKPASAGQPDSSTATPPASSSPTLTAPPPPPPAAQPGN